MIKKKRILVLGNGVCINNIDFSRLQPDIETFGVNRIWLKHIPTYYFFHDADIVHELDENPEIRTSLINNSNIITSDWLRSRSSGIDAPVWAKSHRRNNIRAFPDSISTGLSLLNTHILNSRIDQYIFYMAGIKLKWEEPSHFWKADGYSARNNKDRKWYMIRFQKMFENIRDLRSHGFNFISVTPDSMLNKMMRYENINNLYVT